MSVNPLAVGSKVLIRTVTHYDVGVVAADNPDSILLTDASWVADTGRFSDALNKGTVHAAEQFPDPVLVLKSSIVDITPWRGELPIPTT